LFLFFIKTLKLLASQPCCDHSPSRQQLPVKFEAAPQLFSFARINYFVPTELAADRLRRARQQLPAEFEAVLRPVATATSFQWSL
jgi:hypothetical protein